MKYYNIEIITYNEKETQRIIKKLGEQYKWAKATHNKDIDENGKQVKTHTHLQIYGTTQHSISAWAKMLEVEEYQIQKIDNKIQAIRYLIHKNRKDKYQYDKNIIESNFEIDEYFKEKEDEAKQVLMIIEYINNYKGIIKLSDILSYALINNIWTSYRRNYSILKDYIIERNNLTQSKLFDNIKETRS